MAAVVSDHLAGEHRITVAAVDAVTGNPAVVVSESAPTMRESYVRRALDHVHSITGVLSLEATQPIEYLADEHTAESSSQSVTVHLQQQYKGISIFQATQAVRFSPDGTLSETAGSSVGVIADVATVPTLSVREAVLRAAQHVAVPDADEEGAADEFGEPLDLPALDLTGFAPEVVAAFPDRPDRPTVLESGPFGDTIKASLLWFPVGDDLRLAWEVVLAMPAYAGLYRTIVDAQTGELLYCHQLVQTVAARGNVFLRDGGTQRQMTSFPRTLADYGVGVPGDLPAGFPEDWVENDSTAGNCVIAHLDDAGPVLRGSQNGLLTFDPGDPESDEQKILNLFYLNCYVHDYFYVLGFREPDGNFQRDNGIRGGLATDRVDARAYRGSVFGTANMYTPVEGSSPVMSMGLVGRTGRHTALDATVVIHEFTHGVTNRLVGGPMNVSALDAPQSAGMGEGWGDFFACTVTDSTVIAAWAVRHPGGLRGFPYDSSFPANFGDLGTGRYKEVHANGEIWCATLLEMTKRIGRDLGVQLVVDALKLSPANPSFLNMRDAILVALDYKLAARQVDDASHGAARAEIWAAFAKFGMGAHAKSIGASLVGIEPDFSLPDPPEPPGRGEPPPLVRVKAAPNLTIPDNRSDGVESRLAVAANGQIARMAVTVDVQHTYRGDLRVSLRTPQGSVAVLHDRGGGRAHDLIRSYTTVDTPGLTAFISEEAHGEWTLQVADLEVRDVGTLRRWDLEITLQNG